MKTAYKKIEERTHVAICNYINYKYPNSIFHSDSSGVKLTIGQSVALKKTRKSTEKIPDLFVAEPRINFHGLYLEIKKSHEELYNKNGHIRKNKHILKQAKTLKKLRAKHYCALFCAGFDNAKIIIDAYMNENRATLYSQFKNQVIR